MSDERRAAVVRLDTKLLGQLLGLPAGHAIIRMRPTDIGDIQNRHDGILLLIEGPSLDPVPEHQFAPTINPVLSLSPDGTVKLERLR